MPDKQRRLEELRHRHTVYQRPQDRAALTGLLDELFADEVRIAELRGRLEELDREAARAGVPREWRE